jgi:hypothetical protein
VTEALREWAANRLRQLLDEGVPRKMALLQVKREVKAKNDGLPCSRSSIYAWCKKYGVSTR